MKTTAKDENKVKGNAIVLPESQSAKAATPNDDDKKRAGELARKTGLAQLWNAQERESKPV